MLSSVQTDYAAEVNAADSLHVINIRPIRITTTLDNGLVNRKETDYETFSAAGITAARLNPIAVREYDYASGAPGPLLRTTNYTYLHNANTAYATRNIVDRVLTKTVLNGGGTQAARTTYEYDNYNHPGQPMLSSGAVQHNSTYNTGFIYRGNVTAVSLWLNTNGSYLTTTKQYDDAGNLLSTIDPLGHKTAYDYTDSWGNAACAPSGPGKAYVTGITNALNQLTSKSYNSCTGSMASMTDPNLQTTAFTYDFAGRPLTVNYPNGGQNTFTYNDSIPNSITSATKIDANNNLVQTTSYDGLGRPRQTQVTSDPQGTTYTDTSYDPLSRVSSVSNPYRLGTDPTSSPGITSYAYDPLNRKTRETAPDGSIIQTAYCGSATLVTDATGKWRRSRTNGLGQLIEVGEPNAVGAVVNTNGCPGTGEPIWVTSYAYDALGNLLNVMQNGSHPRSFTYDSLSRLLTSNNPETGQITYGYNNDSVLITKTDARGISTNYSPSDSPIDALHRVTKITYSNGDPAVTAAYDQSNCLGLAQCANSGHRTSMTDAAGSEAWGFDIVHGVHRDQRTNTSSPSNVTKTSTYYLNYLGDVTQAVYPTGRIVNYTYDAADRPSTATDGSSGVTYATDFQTPPSGCLANVVCYTPQGSLYAVSLGQTSSFSGLNLTHSYNNRLQPLEFKALSTGGSAIDVSYSFVDPLTSKNSGHVYSITNNLDSTRSQTFSYDQLNRIGSALTTSTYSTSPAHCWGETYGLDAWGNLQSIAATTNSQYTGCSQESGFTKTADGNNHLSGLSYDLSGNTASDGTFAYTWDGESQLKSAGGVNYAYDGDGRRVSKSNGKFYWYGSGGDILAETDPSGNTTAEYIFFDGKRIAMLPAGGTPVYYLEDMLGTSRVITQNNGVPCYDADFYPYGGERAYMNTCPQNYKFEGKERDTETQNDDFGARYYSWRFGRWLSSDWSAVPMAVPYANLTNPQTLNLYAMVADDPESFADLDGHVSGSDPIYPGANRTPYCDQVVDDGGSGTGPCSSSPAADPYLQKEQAEAQRQRELQQIQNQAQEQNQDQTKTNQPQAPDKPPSWDPKKPLSGDPKDLGPDWRKNPGYKNPHGEEYINDRTGEKIEWNKGRPGPWGPKADRAKDGWHYTPPRGTRGRQMDPGQVIKRVGIAATIGIMIHVIVETAPEWAPWVGGALAF